MPKEEIGMSHLLCISAERHRRSGFLGFCSCFRISSAAECVAKIQLQLEPPPARLNESWPALSYHRLKTVCESQVTRTCALPFLHSKSHHRARP